MSNKLTEEQWLIHQLMLVATNDWDACAEYGAENPLEMGEWFSPEDLEKLNSLAARHKITCGPGASYIDGRMIFDDGSIGEKENAG